MQLLSHSSNKTLYLALGLALVVHFFITMFARFDFFEPAIKTLTQLPPLSITLRSDKPPEPVTQIVAEPGKKVIESRQVSSTSSRQTAQQSRERDYLTLEKWQLGHSINTPKLIARLFEPQPDNTLYLELNARSNTLASLSLTLERPCIDNSKLQAFKICPQQAAIPRLLPELVPAKVEVTDYQLEKWSQLAGIPLFDVRFY